MTTLGHDTPDTDVTLPDALDRQPAYLPVDVAARLLGINENTIRRHPARFAAVKLGAHGSLVVPQSTIRAIAGIR